MKGLAIILVMMALAVPASASMVYYWDGGTRTATLTLNYDNSTVTVSDWSGSPLFPNGIYYENNPGGESYYYGWAGFNTIMGNTAQKMDLWTAGSTLWFTPQNEAGMTGSLSETPLGGGSVSEPATVAALALMTIAAGLRRMRKA